MKLNFPFLEQQWKIVEIVIVFEYKYLSNDRIVKCNEHRDDYVDKLVQIVEIFQ